MTEEIITERKCGTGDQCSSKEKWNAEFRFFQGPLNRGSETSNFQSKHKSSDHTMKHDLCLCYS
jgi:hypothetical protein